MSKESLERYLKYAEKVKAKLSDTTVPEKHKGRSKEYRAFLERELKNTNTKIDSLKLTNADAKK